MRVFAAGGYLIAFSGWALLCALNSSCSSPSRPAQAVQQSEPGGPSWKRDFYAQDGVFVSARRSRESLGGDFDGGTQLIGPDTISIPRVGEGSGLSFAVGRLQRGHGFELGFTQVDYGSVRLRSLDFNALRSYQAGQPLQPYLLLGGFFPWLRLKDASLFMGMLGDADINAGIGIKSGLGLAYYLDPSLSFDVRGLLTWQSFSRAEGVAGERAGISDDLRGWGWSLSIGLTLSLGPSR